MVESKQPGKCGGGIAVQQGEEEVRDMFERAAWPLAQSFLAVFVVSDVASANAALVAGLAAALSVIKTYAKDRVTG